MNRVAKRSQREHRERVQPEGRAHLGQLEKKKDYKKRADDFQTKKKALKVLHKKAAEKNPDEFYYHMVNSEIKDGVHFDKPKEDESSADQIKLMRRSDTRYVQFKIDIEKKKIEKLQAQLHLTESTAGTAQNTHTIFVDTEEEAKNFDPAKYFNTHSALVAQPSSRRLRMDQLQHVKLGRSGSSKADIVVCDRERRKCYEQLQKRKERLRQMEIVLQKLNVEKHLADSAKSGSLKPKKIRSGTAERAPVYKWKYVRKR